jgi:hypothetical protein
MQPPLLENHKGVSWTNIVFALVLALGAMYGLYDAYSCTDAQGVCQSRPCNSETPCWVDLDDNPAENEQCLVGSQCLNEGAVCDPKWFGSACTCRTVAGLARGSCRAECTQ